jgi:hypothetical protein
LLTLLQGFQPLLINMPIFFGKATHCLTFHLTSAQEQAAPQLQDSIFWFLMKSQTFPVGQSSKAPGKFQPN